LDREGLARRPVRVEGERFHYLVHVLRARPGDAVELFDGEGRAYEARVETLTAEAAELAVLGERNVPVARKVRVVQGLPKADKLEWLLQKATELGAGGFHPVSTERAVVKLDPAKAEERRERWQRIVDEAARQCGRADVPPVAPVEPLLEVAHRLAKDTCLLALDPAEDSPSLSTVAARAPGGQPLALVIGPEGGLSPAELEALVSLGAQRVRLGPLTLRTETAALAALAVLRHHDGLLG
jgi:16S rRNA (uracil1498-N3)-methyltransferase